MNSSINLIICGAIPYDPFAVEISDPAQITVSQLKTNISDTTSIPEKELILYFSDSILPDDTPLSQWKDIRSGAAVLVTAKPLIVTLQRYNSDIDVKFELPREAVKKWSTRKFFYFCLFKGGLPSYKCGTYMFAMKGSIIKEEGKMMSEYDCFKNDFIISVTFIMEVAMPWQSQFGNYYYPFSSKSTMKNSEMGLGFGRASYISSIKRQIWGEKDLDESKEKLYLPTSWKLKVKKLDGTSSTIDCYVRKPIYNLKHQISPNNNIRLTFGTTILEDWDDQGNIMLLCSYPDLHDGATLCQINLTEAIKINLVCLDKDNRKINIREQDTCIRIHDQYNDLVEGYHNATPPSIITIDNPNNFTVKKLMSIIKQIKASNHQESVYEGKKATNEVYRIGKEVQAKPDDVISSIEFINDGCTLVTIPKKKNRTYEDDSLW